MDLLSGAALGKQAVDNVRSIVQLAQKFGDVELKRRIVDLEDQVSELARERRRLEELSDEQQRQLEVRAETSFKNPYWYEQGQDVPLCPKCYETSGGKVRRHLTHPAESVNGGSRRHCDTCSQYFYDEGVAPKMGSARMQPRIGRYTY
jgi:hypothetical protein